MKKITAIILMLASSPAMAQSYNDAPYNYNNSEANYDNSPANFRNSPANYDNSPSNYGATNGVYDNDGERMGYVVPNSSGGANVFNNDGERVGYVPAQR